MFRWVGKHALKAALLCAVLVPLALMAAWVVQTVNPERTQSFLQEAWVYGTILRVIAYYVALDVFFVRRLAANRRKLQNEFGMLLSLHHEAMKAGEDFEALREIENDLNHCNSCISSLKSVLSYKPYLWGVVLMFELTIQLIYFTVL